MAQPKPHVSEAVARLRLWVSAAGLIVCLAAVTQTFIYGLAHYTDIRWTSLAKQAADGELKVVVTDGQVGASVSASELRGGRLSESGQQQALAALEPNKVRSKADVILERSNNIAAAAGVIGAFTMLGLTFLGTVIAGGAKVPGVQKAATASTWAMVVFVVALPWVEAMPSLAIPGVFVQYTSVVEGTDGFMGVLVRVAIPLATAAMCAVAVFAFRAGVERGIIVTSVSELDEALERELSSIRKRGVAANAPRSMGALNRALGDSDEEDEQMPAILRNAAGAESMTLRDEPPVRRTAGESLPRPI